MGSMIRCGDKLCCTLASGMVMGKAEGIGHLIQQTPNLVGLQTDLGTRGYDLTQQARRLVI